TYAPAVLCMRAKVITVTPTTTGIAASALRTMNLASMGSSTPATPPPSRGRWRASAGGGAQSSSSLAVRDVDRVEPGPRRGPVPRADVPVLDTLADAPDRLRVGDQRRRQVLHEDLLDLLVQALALLTVERHDRLVEEVVHLG